MPLVPLSQLPDSARLWAFGADRALRPEERARLLELVDDFLRQWKAHGTPLHAGRDLRGERFLLVAVDEDRAPPSGCSIDALVRSLKTLEEELGLGLVDKAPVWYRDGEDVKVVSRPEFKALAEAGEVDSSTAVFDLTLTRLAELREEGLERPAQRAWHGRVFFGQEARE